MKGLFIPEITAEMFKNGCLEGIEALMAEGEIYDIEYSPWIPVSERLPDYMDNILITFQKPNREPLVYRAVFIGSKFALDNGDVWNWNDPEIKAWMPLPEPYKEAENDKDSNRHS